MNVVLLLFTFGCLIYALVRKRFIWLLAPVGLIFAYTAVQIVLVPLPLGETLTFIFNLR